MTVSIFDSATRAAFIAATTQQAQCEALRDAFGGNVEARGYGAGGQHLRTVVLGPFTINGATPRGLVPGAYISDTAVAPVTPGAAGIAVVLWEFRKTDGTVIFTSDEITHGVIKSLCRPTFTGGTANVLFTANAALPVDNTNARISIWGQSNAVGEALRTGIASITADPGLVDWDDGTLTFDRVKFWNGTAYAAYVPGSNHGSTSDKLGPEFGLAVDWMRRTTAGTLYLDKNAVGGFSITSFVPPSSTRWTAGISAKAAQDAWLSSNGVTIPAERTFWFWSQGEADNGQTQSWYETRLQDLVDGLVTEGYLPARSVLTDIPAASLRDSAAVSAAKAAVAAVFGSAMAVQLEPAFFESDVIHLNAYAQILRSYNAFGHLFQVTPSTL